MSSQDDRKVGRMRVSSRRSRGTEGVVVPTPEGSGQATHPDVIDTHSGFEGFRYWMVCTPYPWGNDRFENPILRVSDDGLKWVPFPGAPDPLFPAPEDPDYHCSDPDMVLVDGRLHVILRVSNRYRPEEDELLYISSSDGKQWTPPRTVWSGAHAVSPALDFSGSRWRMWIVEGDDTGKGGRTLVRLEGGAVGEWESSADCDMEILGHEIWHIDIMRTPQGYEALVAAFPTGSDSSRTSLFMCSSEDGLTFGPPRALFRPRLGTFYSRMVYRSTMTVAEGDGRSIWLSGADWKDRNFIARADLTPQGGVSLYPPEDALGRTYQWASDLKAMAYFRVRRRVRGPVHR